MIPPDPHSGRDRPPPAPNTQLGLWPGAEHKRPSVGTQTLVPLNFSAVVVPLAQREGATPLMHAVLYSLILYAVTQSPNIFFALNARSLQPSYQSKESRKRQRHIATRKINSK